MTNEEWVLIGKKQYNKELVAHLNQEYFDLIEKWDALDFSKWGSLEIFLVYGSMEALLCEHNRRISYVLTSQNDYPSLPLDDFEFAEMQYRAALVGQKVAAKFKIPDRYPSEGQRQYFGRIADAFENYCDENNLLLDFKFNDPVGFFAADSFLRIACANSDE